MSYWNLLGDEIIADGGWIVATVHDPQPNVTPAVSSKHLTWQEFQHYAQTIVAAPQLYDVCVEIREAFDYFSEWDLPVGFEDRLNAALTLCGYERKEE